MLVMRVRQVTLKFELVLVQAQVTSWIVLNFSGRLAYLKCKSGARKRLFLG